MTFYVGLIVHRKNVKSIKTALEEHNVLNKVLKIKPYDDPMSCDTSLDAFAVIPTVQPFQVGSENLSIETRNGNELKSVLTALFGPSHPSSLDCEVVGILPVIQDNPGTHGRYARNPLHKAVSSALLRVNLALSSLDKDLLLGLLPPSFNLYPPMLLLPSHCFHHEQWKSFFQRLDKLAIPQKEAFLAEIAEGLQISHIAMNAPIPARNIISNAEANVAEASENLLRSPINLKPMYGDFGPALPAFPDHVPTLDDFNEAFWVQTQQNGITQIWAPRYTMFSSGNVTEKARILEMPSVREAVQDGVKAGLGCTAVDLFAGIGYFAFSYARAGVSKVLCWDLNPWSLEGLRRGANANHWNAYFFDTAQAPSASSTNMIDFQSSDKGVQEASFLVFSENNHYAGQRIAALRPKLPPIRHVNCGMLPSVGHAWKIACEALEPDLGGWLHLHETAHQDQIEERGEILKKLVADYVCFLSTDKSKPAPEVKIEHIEKVKSVGPRLWHIVVDLWVDPRS